MAYKDLVIAMERRATELGYTVRPLALALRMPPTTVHKTLKRQRRIDPLEFLRWAEVLRIDDPIGFLRTFGDSRPSRR